MKRSFLFVLALFIGQIVFSQQRSAYELISENPDRAACNMHSYEFPDYIDTRVPRGFKPVYISHYGRHGSRYDVSSSMSNLAISSLQHIDSLGQLTHQGKQLLKALQNLLHVEDANRAGLLHVWQNAIHGCLGRVVKCAP